MLVYSTTLWLQNSSSVDSVLDVVSRWLTRKAGEGVTAALLKSTWQKRMREGNLQVISSDESFPILQSVRFTHGDREVSGRQWVTEIGIRQERNDSEIECSVLLRTDEISTRVEAKIQPTAPFVIHEIIKHCSPSAGTIGLSIKTLDNESEVEAFGYAIGYSQRRHPYVLVSPTTDDRYLVDVERLRFLLEGLADVVQIPIGADTFLIQRMLGKQYAAWRGAINLIFPEVYVHGKHFAPTKRLMPDELDEMISEGISPETDILSTITHRTNLPNSWIHISPEAVSEILRRRELARLQKEASETGESAEYIALLEEDNRDQAQKIGEAQQKINQLQDEVNALEGVITQMDDEKRQLNFENESLKLSLSYTGDARGSGNGIPDSVRDVLLNVASQSFTLKESLLVIKKLFPERVEVLESAWKSADDSEIFKERKKAFELLWKLVTDYWDGISSGKGDAEMRGVFGNAYAARESEKAEANPRSRQLRTFNYKGNDIVMMSHLRIGVKESVAETLRIHFEWDSNDRKIIIGHCGQHLDHK